MNLYDVMMKRRSVRIFKDQEIPNSIIEQLLDVANNSPLEEISNPSLSSWFGAWKEGRNWLSCLEVSPG